jgi:hypothetical protein
LYTHARPQNILILLPENAINTKRLPKAGGKKSIGMQKMHVVSDDRSRHVIGEMPQKAPDVDW